MVTKGTVNIIPGSPPLLDVSELPESAFDWRDPVWWGNTLLIVIETVTIALLLAAWFYIRRNYEVFPPPKVDVFPPIHDTRPGLLWGTVNLAVLVLSCAVMWLTDQAARKLRKGPVIAGLVVMLLVALVTCWIRWQEFHSVKFWWNDNAYASCVWMILGTHATYLIATAIEFLMMLLWVVTHELDEHHALDITLCGGYWYWVAAVFAIVYGVVYWGPRFAV